MHPHHRVAPERMYALTYSLFLNIYVLVCSQYVTPQTQGRIYHVSFHVLYTTHWQSSSSTQSNANTGMIESTLHTAALPGTGLIHFRGVCVCVCRSQGEVRIGLLTVSTDSSANRASLRGDLIRAGGCTSGRPHNKWPTVPRTPVAYEIKRTFITLSVIPLCPWFPFLSQSASSGGRRGSHHYLWRSECKTCSRTNSHTEVLCPAVFFHTWIEERITTKRLFKRQSEALWTIQLPVDKIPLP